MENESESTAGPVTSKVNVKPCLGRMYNVKRLDGQWCPAEVLEKRDLKNGQSVEYFVHFENCIH